MGVELHFGVDDELNGLKDDSWNIKLLGKGVWF